MAIYDVNGRNLSESGGMFANVTDFGAIGDGAHNDASAIQSALDSLKDTGGVIYFPCGTYLINTAVHFYSNQTLWFELGARLLQSAAIDNMMRSYCNSSYGGYNGTHDVVIYGATFDGGVQTTNNTLVAIAHCKNITFENCKFLNAYGKYHSLEINSSYNVKVINCEFEGSRRTGTDASKGEMLQIDGAGSSGYYPWDNFKVDNTVSQYIEISGCLFHDGPKAPAIGNHSGMAHKFINIHDCGFDNITCGRGAINFVSDMQDIDIHDNEFNGCTNGVGIYSGSSTEYFIRNNRFVGVTTAISSSVSTAHANMINGTYTA